jgi:SAM-dependent methyltransferase
MADLTRQIKIIAERKPIDELDIRHDQTPYSGAKFQRMILKGEYPDAPGPGQILHESQFMMHVLELNEESSLLDIGCGNGAHCLELARSGVCCTGIDIGELLIKNATRTAAREKLAATFAVRDIRRHTPREKFNAVILLGHTLGMFPDKSIGPVIKKAAGSLKNGGRILLELENRDAVNFASENPWSTCRHSDHYDIVFHEEHFNPRSARWWVRNYSICGKSGRVECTIGCTRVFTLPELEKLFNDAGIKLTAAYGDWRERALDADSELMLVTGRKIG